MEAVPGRIQTGSRVEGQRRRVAGMEAAGTAVVGTLVGVDFAEVRNRMMGGSFGAVRVQEVELGQR